MRDFASCLSEHAVKVSDTSCSGGSSSALDPSVQSTVTSLYRSRLSSGKDLLVRVTWAKTLAGPVLSVAVDSAAKTQLLKKTRGSLSFVSGDIVVGLHWDVSTAKYSTPGSPEPSEDFYLIIIAAAEFALLLGDASRDYVKKFDKRVRLADFSMISRREKVVGRSLYSTKAPLGEGGREREIVIRWLGNGSSDESELSVSVEKKKVVHVKRLNWNFRGNQIIFVDGSPVDMMWDVHGWWFGGPSGHAAFMFRSRSALENRLWPLEEEMAAAAAAEQKDSSSSLPCFSLLIQAFRS